MNINNINKAVLLNDELKELETALTNLTRGGSVNVLAVYMTDNTAVLRNSMIRRRVADAIGERIAEIKERIKEL